MVEEVGETGNGDDADAPDFAAIEADYLNSRMTVRALCAKHELSVPRFARLRRRMGWPMRQPQRAAIRADMIGRMMKLIDHLILQLEQKGMDASDKEVALLGNLTKTLEKLMDLEERKTGTTPARTDGTEIRQMRDELVKRMRALEKS